MESTNQWKKKVESLVKKHGEVQTGPWDPNREHKTTESVNKFYSGHPMPPRKLRFRERFARWAIDEVNKEYLPGRFKVTGEIMQTEMVSYQAVGSKSVPKEVVDAIRADGQLDIDAEDPKPPTKKGSDDFELLQSVDGASQALISGSPNSLGFPIEACATYLRMEKCGEYGRNNLSVWKSPLFPKLTAKDGCKGFLDNQITAIPWILSRFLGELPKLKRHESPYETENRNKMRGPMYSGAILADSMGLGKTLTTIACLDLMARMSLNVQVDAETGKKRHYPMLILCPNPTVVAQWVEEILQSTSTRSIKKIIVSGGSQDLYPADARVRYLSSNEFEKWPRSVDYVWNDDDKRASKTVLVISIDTWSFRTCVEMKDEQSGSPEWFSTFTELGRHFSVVCVDEAHKVKNALTRNWKSVGLLNRVHTLLITATPCLNTLTDLLGLARMLWETPSKFLEEECPDSWARIASIVSLSDLGRLDEVEPWDDLQLAAGRPSLLSMLLCKGWRSARQDIGETRKYLRYFESLAILRRGSGSFLFQDWEKTRPVSLEGLFPVVENWTVNIESDPRLAKEYQAAHSGLLIKYLKALEAMAKRRRQLTKAAKSREAENALASINTLYQKWPIASASMDVFKLSERLEKGGLGTLVAHISTMRAAGVTFVQLAEFLREPDDPKPETAIGYLKLAVRGSPILRYILHDIKENVLRPEAKGDIKKLLITESSPILAYYYELVLQFLGINCRTFHADLTQDQRKDLIESFNSKHPDTCQVLIQMYNVGYAGSNLHHNCARVIVASQAHSLAVQSQAVHRVIRVGQTKDVKVYRLKVDNSFHAFRESRQIEKILPELGSRAQGGMNNVLVQLLNLFQSEVDDAWESKEGQALMADKSLLTHWVFPDLPPAAADHDDESTAETDNLADSIHANVNQWREDGDSDVTDSDSDSDSDDQEAEEVEEPLDAEKEILGAFGNMSTASSTEQSNGGDAGWFNRCPPGAGEKRILAAFLEQGTRSDFYEEFKKLPEAAKAYFDHKKNHLRRLLSYHHRNRKTTWTLEDLDKPAVLERAIELMMRVRLGAGHIEMLPLPQIEFPTISKDTQTELHELIGNFVMTTQDVDKVQKQVVGKKATDGITNTMKGINKYNSLEDIDEMFKKEERFKGCKTKPESKKEDADAEDGVLMKDIPLFIAKKDLSYPKTTAPVKLRRKIKREYSSEGESEDSESHFLHQQGDSDDEDDKYARRQKQWGPPPKVRHYDSDINDTDREDTDSEDTSIDIELTTSQRLSHPQLPPLVTDRGVKREVDANSELSFTGSRKVPRPDTSTRSPASVFKREPSWENKHHAPNGAFSTNGPGAFPSPGTFSSPGGWSFDRMMTRFSSPIGANIDRNVPIIDLTEAEPKIEPGWENGAQRDNREAPVIDLTGFPIKHESGEASDSDELEFICSRPVNRSAQKSHWGS